MSKPNAYEKVTAQILDAIAAGVVPWRRPWDVIDAHRNAQTNRPYSGVNALVLAVRAHLSGWTDPRWTTYNAAKKAGGQVRKGERGTHVLLFKQTTRPGEDGEDGETTTRRGWYATAYCVFNAAQVDGLDLPAIDTSGRDTTPHDASEELIAAYLANNGPAWHVGGHQAYYRPSGDSITMPPAEAFHTPEARYHTAFHEIAHSTGHASRLNRDEIAKMATTFGQPDYALEELVAELTASYLSGHVGLELDLPQTAAYLDGWHSALSRDPRMMVTAASRAYKAADLVIAAEAAAGREETPVLAAA